jgi:hypothetical protein
MLKGGMLLITNVAAAKKQFSSSIIPAELVLYESWKFFWATKYLFPQQLLSLRALVLRQASPIKKRSFFHCLRTAPAHSERPKSSNCGDARRPPQVNALLPNSIMLRVA